MKSLLPEDRIPRTEHADEVWTQEQDDALLDDFFAAGGSPETLAIKHKRKPKAIVRRIDYYRDNERDWVLKYKPGHRISRKGKRITANDKVIIEAHRKKKIPVYLTARVLARDVSEIDGHEEQLREDKNLAALAPKLDRIWAYRYIFLIYKRSLISDTTYNDLVEEEIEYGGGTQAFAEIKHHLGWPEHIKSLALYLVQKQDALTKEAATTYTVGEKEGLYGGPFPTLKEARAWDGKSVDSRIYESKGSFTRAIARWLVEEQRWEMRE